MLELDSLDCEDVDELDWLLAELVLEAELADEVELELPLLWLLAELVLEAELADEVELELPLLWLLTELVRLDEDSLDVDDVDEADDWLLVRLLDD